MGSSDDAKRSPRRRADGDGSVYQDKEGKWFAALRFAPGQRPHVVRAQSKQDAEIKLKDLRKRRDVGVVATTGRQTVADWLESWMRTVVLLDSKRTTIRFNRQRIENHLIPILGDIRLDDLKPDHIRGMQAKLLKIGKAPRTINHDLAVLSAALEVAVEDRKILYNPAKSVKKLKVPAKKEVQPLSPSEAAAILWAVQGHRLEAMYHLAFWGFRIGELLGLRTKDVDLRAGTITVEQTAVALDGGKMDFDTPKSENARRTLPLTPRLIAVLRQRFEMLLIERGYEGWQEHGLLFPSDRGTILSQGNAARHLQDTVLPTAGIDRPFSWHQFRHTATTWLAEIGTTDEITRAIIGHSVQSVTDRYRHISPEALRPALEAMERTKLGDVYAPSEEQAKDRAWRLKSAQNIKRG